MKAITNFLHQNFSCKFCGKLIPKPNNYITDNIYRLCETCKVNYFFQYSTKTFGYNIYINNNGSSYIIITLGSNKVKYYYDYEYKFEVNKTDPLLTSNPIAAKKDLIKSWHDKKKFFILQ